MALTVPACVVTGPDNRYRERRERDCCARPTSERSGSLLGVGRPPGDDTPRGAHRSGRARFCRWLLEQGRQGLAEVDHHGDNRSDDIDLDDDIHIDVHYDNDRQIGNHRKIGNHHGVDFREGNDDVVDDRRNQPGRTHHGAGQRPAARG